MEKSVFLSTFESVEKNGFRVENGFTTYEDINVGTHMFLKGNLYNKTPLQVLESYILDGVESLKSVDGDYLIIFAESRKTVVVRDRHGVGSQFFYTEKYFSNSLTAFCNLSDFACTPDTDSLKTFLSIGYIPSPQTALEGVLKLKAGCVLVCAEGRKEIVDLYPSEEYMSKVSTTDLSLDEAIHEYEQLHKAAISSRINGASKVGLLLSGGYDSGGNISALRDVYQGDVVSYSIGFKNNPWTELPLAKILSQRYNSRHYEYEIDGSEILQLPHLIGITGDPFQEGGLMVNYTAMRLVQLSGESPDVILGGDGNDQHFGTSGKELAMHWKLKAKGIQPLQKLYDYLGDSCPMFDADNILFRTEFHNRKILHIQQSDIFGFGLRKLNTMSASGKKLRAFKYLENAPGKYKDFDDFYFNRNLNIDIKQVINEVILYKSSRMSELFGNHITFPYMSTDLYGFLNKMPVNYKFKGSLDELAAGKGVSKFLHKSYLKPKLPVEITDRKKQGGFAPLPIFLQDDFQRKKIFDFIRNSDAVKELFNKNAIERLLDQYEKLVKENSYWFWFRQVKANQVINLYTVAVWWEMIMNKKTQALTLSDLL